VTQDGQQKSRKRGFKKGGGCYGCYGLWAAPAAVGVVHVQKLIVQLSCPRGGEGAWHPEHVQNKQRSQKVNEKIEKRRKRWAQKLK